MKKNFLKRMLGAFLCTGLLAGAAIPAFAENMEEPASVLELPYVVNGNEIEMESDEGVLSPMELGSAQIGSASAETMSASSTVSANSLVATMLSHVGDAYSQANREGAHSYDCSSLVRRSFAELGITTGIDTTSQWNSQLGTMSIGDTITFSGSGGSITYKLAATNFYIINNQSVAATPGTILVYILPGSSSGHIAVSCGSFARQDSGYDPNVNPSAIVSATRSYIANSLASNFGASAATLLGTNAYTGTQNILIDSNHLGPDMNLGGGNYSGTYNSIFTVDAMSPTYGVCVNNCISATYQGYVKYALVPVAGGGSSTGTGTYGADGIDYSPVYDMSYYLQANPDVYSAYGNNATAVFNHFYNNGMSEARRANEDFYVVAYKNRYPDLQAAFGNNWKSYYVHWIQHGRFENRIGN